MSDKPPDACPRCGSQKLDRVGPPCQLLPDAWHRNWHTWAESIRPKPQARQFPRRARAHAVRR